MVSEASRFLNLQLHRAQLLFKSLASQDQGSDLSLASRQAFMRHLNFCYRALLQELLELVSGQSVNSEQIYSATQLVGLLEAEDTVVPELVMLAEKELNTEWLRAILDAMIPFVVLPGSNQNQGADALANTIKVSQVDDYQRDNYSLEVCDEALAGLAHCVEACRETAQEW